MIPLGAVIATPTLAAAVSAADGLSSLWRIELLHPAVAHFPIALILFGTALWLLGGAAARWPRLDAFALVGTVTIVITALFAWAATETGFWADEVVGRELFDPRPLKDHENVALLFSWIASGAGTGALVWRFAPLSKNVRRVLWWSTTAALLAACVVIAYVAHLGAGLVYQQGAGVIMPQ